MSSISTIAIGFGPANVALAIAAEEAECGNNFTYFEARDKTLWQPGMLIASSDIQNNPMRDLVSLHNPRSRYSFHNYLFEQGRLLEYLNLPSEFPLRTDFARYVEWAASEVSASVHHGQQIKSISIDPRNKFQVTTEGGLKCEADRLVIGTGRTPYVPKVFQSVVGDRVFHSTSYLSQLPMDEAQEAPKRILIVGASQSAVELALDLADRFPKTGVTLLSRGMGPRLKDTSPFSEHAYFPDFTSYYYNLDRAGKRRIDSQLRASNYSSVDSDVLHHLYLKMYQQGLGATSRIQLLPFSEVVDVKSHANSSEVTIREMNTAVSRLDEFDLIILATGFRDLGPGPRQEDIPSLLEPLRGDLRFDEDGYLVVYEDYELSWSDGSRSGIYLNGLCESSHGLGDAGSFSLLSVRVQTILRSILGSRGKTPAGYDQLAVNI